MDRFSFIVVDVSLRALMVDPSLHARFREGGETIVFKANDYADPAEVPRFFASSKRSPNCVKTLTIWSAFVVLPFRRFQRWKIF